MICKTMSCVGFLVLANSTSKLVGGYKLVLIYGLKTRMKIEDQKLLITSSVKSHSNKNMKAIQDKVLVCLDHSHD
jgi:hypothetical protein